MSSTIDYYFTSVSPFAYIGHKALMNIADKHGVSVNFKPFNLMGVWENSGAVMPGERPLVRQRYRILDLQRAAEIRELNVNPKPVHFPTNPTNADLCVCAAVISGNDAASLAHEFGRAVWERNLQIADEEVLGSIITELGMDGDKILTLSKSDEATQMRAENTESAVAADAVGAPAYVYKGEVFWGQDRIEYLDQMITSGREAFLAEI